MLRIRKIWWTLWICTAISASAIAFIPLPQKVRMRPGQAAALPRHLHPAVLAGDTIVIYLADAAGNLVTGLGVVDSVGADSFYVRRSPGSLPLSCSKRNPR